MTSIIKESLLFVISLLLVGCDVYHPIRFCPETLVLSHQMQTADIRLSNTHYNDEAVYLYSEDNEWDHIKINEEGDIRTYSISWLSVGINKKDLSVLHIEVEQNNNGKGRYCTISLEGPFHAGQGKIIQKAE